MGCRCAPRPGIVAVGSGTTAAPCASEPATTRSNSLFAARSRQPMHVLTGAAGAVGSGQASVSGVRTTVVQSTGSRHQIPNRAGRYRGRMPPAEAAADRRSGRRADRWYDDFAGPDLDRAVWLPHYLPAWSSRADSAAAYHLTNGSLVLDIPVDHPHWCAGDHEPPLRVSGLQTGSHSGPVGSTVGQQPFREGQVVREEQPRFAGLLVDGGRVEIRCRADLSPRSMASLWMVGFEDRPERCGEICVFEVFGRSVRDGTAEVGCGLHAFRDPDLAEDFAAPRLEVDVATWHTYAVTWDRTEAVFALDGREVRRCPRPPAYPLQLMLAVFDFPAWSVGDDDHLVPSLTVDHVSWSAQPATSA